ncbi:MAG: Calx-beta domain-containing protein, partial [Chloroflexota bacterium]
MDKTKPRQWSRFAASLSVTLIVLFVALFAGILDARANTVQSSSALSALLQTEVIGFDQGVYTVNEGSVATIDVSIIPAPDDTVTVEYITTDGTGRAGVDYVSATGILTFTNNSASQSFEVATIPNSRSDGDRTVNLLLFNAEGGVLDPSDRTAVLLIEDDEPSPTATSKSPTATPVFVDLYEPNNTLGTAYGTSAGSKLCAATLWPAGDVDWYRFVLKKNRPYQIQTSDLSSGLDTILSVYNPSGNLVTTNDDYQFGSLASQVILTASQDGYYYAKIQNKSSSDPANKTYCIQVTETQPTATPTGLPTSTRVPGADVCEYNGDFNSACLTGAGTTLDLNFVPIWGEGPDNDFFRLWVKPGIMYTCRTFDLSSVNDTNMILYDQNQNGIGGNDDRAVGDFSSEVTYYSTYTGWLYVLVGPVAPPSYADSFLYTYSLECTESVVTPTPMAPPTLAPSTGPVIRPPTATPTSAATPVITVTAPIAIATVPTLTPTPTPNVIIQPLPTSTPAVSSGRSVDFDLTVYYDANRNFTPELTEGVEDVAVAVYDNTTNELLAFGYTNEAGVIRFSSLVASG